MTRLFTCIAFAAIVATPQLVMADSSVVYRWTDGNGAVHISNRLSDAPEKYRASAKPMEMVVIDSQEPDQVKGSAKLVGGSKIAFDTKKEGIVSLARFNGLTERNAILDTGSGWAIITTKLAIALGYDLENARKSRFKVFGGSVSAPVVSLKSLQVGPAFVSNVSAAVIDFEGRGPVSAIIGMNFLSRFVFEIDHSKGEVEFKASEK